MRLEDAGLGWIGHDGVSLGVLPEKRSWQLAYRCVNGLDRRIADLMPFRCRISWKYQVDCMALHLDIPESITSSLRLPEQEMEPRLRAELAVALYSQGILPFGKASELAGIPRLLFADLVGRRGILRHYTEQELAQDLEYAGG
jgi:predicted HTH domain antitoxin